MNNQYHIRHNPWWFPSSNVFPAKGARVPHCAQFSAPDSTLHAPGSYKHFVADQPIYSQQPVGVNVQGEDMDEEQSGVYQDYGMELADYQEVDFHDDEADGVNDEIEEDELVDEGMDPSYNEGDDHEEGGEGGTAGTKPPSSRKPKAVHQCNVCNKLFASFKGLQQHAIIHTNEKPFVCSICAKSFRFKSNLFEHRSVHDNVTPHQCPYCGKTCRLKGNLKKHLKTHVGTKEELDEAWRPFASNRRPPADIPDDAIIVRSSGEPLSASALFTPPSRGSGSNRPRRGKGKAGGGLGIDPSAWVEKIRRGELLASPPIEEKMKHLEELLHKVEDCSLTLERFFVEARALPLECYACPICKTEFMSRLECMEHLDSEHPNARLQRPLFCECCLKSFADRKSWEQHESYHTRVRGMINGGELEIRDPDILLPEEACGAHTEMDVNIAGGAVGRVVGAEEL